MKRVAAIVVTYNRKDLLLQNIEHLLNQKPTSPDIIVIDNNSTDGTKDSLSPYIEDNRIQYVNTRANLGGAGGFSFGIRHAVEKGYDYLWIMDDDSFPEPSALQNLLKKDHELSGNYGFLSSKVLWKDDSICIMNRQKITKWNRVSDFDKPHQIQYASFVSLFLKREVVLDVGLPYKEFFIWSDDFEYTRRISKKYPCYYVPESVVHHWCGSNFGTNIVLEDANRLDRYRYAFRNDVVLYRQDGLEGSFYLFLRINMLTFKVLMKATDKKKRLQIMFSSLNEGRKFYPAIDYPETKGESL